MNIKPSTFSHIIYIEKTRVPSEYSLTAENRGFHRRIGGTTEARSNIVKTLIRLYQCGCRRGNSSIDQIFTLCQILEKIHNTQVDAHHLFVEYKACFDSPIRDRVFAAMSELSITAKLIRLYRMRLSNSCSFVKVGMDLFEPSDTVRVFRHGNPLSSDLFNFVMEIVLQKAGVHCIGTIFQKKCPVA